MASGLNEFSSTSDPVIMKVEPTYRLRPSEEEKFRPSEARRICEEVMASMLEGHTWSGEGESVLAREITQEVRRRVKEELELPRYKIVVQVTVGQRRKQTVRVGSRCLWDAETDNYATAFWQNETMWCNAVVFAFYTE